LTCAHKSSVFFCLEFDRHLHFGSKLHKLCPPSPKRTHGGTHNFNTKNRENQQLNPAMGFYSFRVFFYFSVWHSCVRMYRKSIPLTRIRHSLAKFVFGLKSCENITKLLNLVIILHVFKNMQIRQPVWLSVKPYN
jgi:hypothetical protein